jgi:hypothetical protein
MPGRVRPRPGRGAGAAAPGVEGQGAASAIAVNASTLIPAWVANTVEKPEFGADWELRAQVQFLFPK